MDVITTKVNLVIEPVDGFTGESLLQGAVFARINNSNNAYAMKKDGCFVFFNRPPGKYGITVFGSCYQSAEFDVEFDENVKTMTVTLMPSRSYRFPRTASKLYGKANAPAQACFIYSNEQARILGEYKTGETKISAFFSDKNPIRHGQKYSVGGSAYYLKHLSGTEYELDRPLESGIDGGSAVGVCCEIAQRGDYFIAVSGSFKAAEIICGKNRKTIGLSGENTEYNIE